MRRRFTIPRDIVTLVASVAAAIVLSVATILVVSVPRSNVVAALFPPWWGSKTIFEAAAEAGDPVRLGRFPWVMIVHGDPSHLAHRLRTAGALLLVDSRFFAGCGT
jgi:hypothetical protein